MELKKVLLNVYIFWVSRAEPAAMTIYDSNSYPGLNSQTTFVSCEERKPRLFREVPSSDINSFILHIFPCRVYRQH